MMDTMDFRFLGPIGSILANRYGFQLVIIVGALISSVGFFLSYFVYNFWLLFMSFGVLTGTIVSHRKQIDGPLLETNTASLRPVGHTQTEVARLSCNKLNAIVISLYHSKR